MIGPNALLSIPGRMPGEETFPKGTCQKGMLVSMHMVFLSPGFILHKGDACENSDPYFFHPSKKKKIQEILGGGGQGPSPPFLHL